MVKTKYILREKQDIKKLITYLLTGIVVFLILFPIFRFYYMEIRKEKCLKESVRLWNTVNVDYPYVKTLQESYEKNNRQSCASFYYIACIHGMKVECASIQTEKD